MLNRYEMRLRFAFQCSVFGLRMGCAFIRRDLRLRFVLTVVGWGLAWLPTSQFVHAADLVFNAFTRDDQRISGQLAGRDPGNLRFVRSAGVELTLDRIQSLNLPISPRALPDRGWKQARLTNGDVLHLRLISQKPLDQQPVPDQVSSPKWTAGFTATAELPLSSVASLAHSPGTRCLIYEDFESSAAGWRNAAGHAIFPNRERGRSGESGLKCEPQEPTLHYELLKPLPKGWMEFSFYSDPQSEPTGECSARLRFHGSKALEIKVGLVGEERWYEVSPPEIGDWQHQNIPRRPGWHTVAVQCQTDEIQVTLDGFQLVQGRLARDVPLALVGIGISSSLKSGAVWIDDFAIVESSASSHTPLLQRDSDQLDMPSGDQFFGKLNRLDTQSVHFSVNSRVSTVPWSDVAELRLATRRFVPRSVEGWIASIDLQPWNTAPELQDADSIRGALLSADRQSCVVDHPLCGQLTIPWSDVCRIQPAYRGREWAVEGRIRHLGNEMKSAFATPIPEGTHLKWSCELPTVPRGVAHVALTAVDLEPAAPGTRAHRWLEQLRKGALTSELWINDRRITILNQEVTGRGTTDQPRMLRIRLPDGALVVGKNEIAIRQQPGTGAVIEYDDWELRDLRLEVEATPM